MKIYTRTGDAGGTALFGGTRVSKADPRVAAYGDVDELNACLGAVRAQKRARRGHRRTARAASEGSVRHRRAAGRSRRKDRGTRHESRGDGRRHSSVSKSGSIDSRPSSRRCAASFCPAAIAPARCCISRGPSAAAPNARSWRSAPDHVEAHLLAYVNRLSDLLFVMARAVNHRAGQPEVEW